MLVLTVVGVVVSLVADLMPLVPLVLRVAIEAGVVVLGVGALVGFRHDQREQLSERAARDAAFSHRLDELPKAIAAEMLTKGFTPNQVELVRESAQRAITGVVSMAVPIGITARGIVGEPGTIAESKTPLW